MPPSRRETRKSLHKEDNVLNAKTDLQKCTALKVDFPFFRKKLFFPLQLGEEDRIIAKTLYQFIWINHLTKRRYSYVSRVQLFRRALYASRTRFGESFRRNAGLSGKRPVRDGDVPSLQGVRGNLPGGADPVAERDGDSGQLQGSLPAGGRVHPVCRSAHEPDDQIPQGGLCAFRTVFHQGL